MTDVTRILSQIESGDQQASADLLPLVYDELRKLAAAKMAAEQPGQTLQATGLVHEAYMRLVGSEKPQRWDGRGHFFAAAAEAMRRVLVENARSKQRLKRGGGRGQESLVQLDPSMPGPSMDILALNEAIEKLNAQKPQIAELVKLRFFTGLTVDEAASVMGISRATADRHWTYARTWLHRELAVDP